MERQGKITPGDIDIQVQSAVIRAIKRLQRTRHEWSLDDWNVAISHLRETMLTGIALRDHSIQVSLPEPGQEE